MQPEDFYTDASRRLQHRFGTEELAAHLARRYVRTALADEHIDWIHQADAVYLATVDPRGHPDCSYKGGLPGFIRAPDRHTLEIPSYDGNGMYRTLGNAAGDGWVGLLFLLPELPAKLRVNGASRVLTDAGALAGHPGAEAVLKVDVREVFENCPRYLHDRATGQHSVHCPRPDYRPPEPEWKGKPEYRGLLPAPHHEQEGLR